MKMCDCNQGRLPCTCKAVEMISVPRERLAEIAHRDSAVSVTVRAEDLRAILAEQHQGEPVALPARKPDMNASFRGTDAEWYGNISWNACLDEIAKLGPLYTRPAPADTEPRGAFAKCMEAMADRDAAHKREDTLRAQLAERDALLRKVVNGKSRIQFDGDLMHRILMALSASAEQSAPECSKCGSLNVDACIANGCWFQQEQGAPKLQCLNCNAEFTDTEAANCEGCCWKCGAAVAPKCPDCNGTGSSGGRMHVNGIDEPEYERFKCETCDGFGSVGNILNAEPCPDCSYSAPFERDERWCADIGYTLKSSDSGNGFKPGYGSELFSAWQARAALERKS